MKLDRFNAGLLAGLVVALLLCAFMLPSSAENKYYATAASTEFIPISTKVEAVEEYMVDLSTAGTTGVGALGMKAFTANGGTVGQSAIETSGGNNSLGRCRLNTDSATNGFAGIQSAGAYVYPQSGTTGGSVVVEHRIMIQNGLSDGTDTYSVRAGLLTSGTPNGSAGAEEVTFTYTHSEYGGNFACKTRTSSTETVTDSGVAMAEYSHFNLRIEINAAGNSVVFKINNTTVATHTTNIPSYVRPGVTILKSAGTSNKVCDVELSYFRYIPTTPR